MYRVFFMLQAKHKPLSKKNYAVSLTRDKNRVEILAVPFFNLIIKELEQTYMSLYHVTKGDWIVSLLSQRYQRTCVEWYFLHISKFQLCGDENNFIPHVISDVVIHPCCD